MGRISRLVEVNKVADGSIVASYAYDGVGRRVKQTVNGVVTTFLYNGWSNEVVAEFNGTGNLTKYYTWSPTGELLSITDYQTTGTPTYYTVRNAHGDIVQLTDVNGNIMDSNGNIYGSYTYDAWGNIVSQTGTVASVNPYRYAGYRYDEATGLYYLMARYYDPEVGRFISKDPVFQNNMYVYASNNPIMYVDPDGQWFWMAVNVGSAIYEGYSAYQAGGSWGNAALAA
jgi:RHS repeat-associated protein